MFVVYDQGRPAAINDIPSVTRFQNNKFDSFSEAVEYAKEWLDIKDLPADLKPNTPYDYSGYGDDLLIKEE